MLTHNPIRYGTNPGCYYEFRFSNNQVFFKGAARILIVGKRQYQIATFLEEENYDKELALAFLDSFKILEDEPESKEEPDTKTEAGNDAGNEAADDAEKDSSSRNAEADGSKLRS
jgi:hypothetical protein